MNLLSRWFGSRADAQAENVQSSKLLRDLAKITAQLEATETRLAMARNTAKRLNSGVKQSGDQFTYEENDQLKGTNKWATLKKMGCDPHVAGALDDAKLPLLNAQWKIHPASDSVRDQDIADFVSANLLRTVTPKYGREYWCRTGWRGQRLPEILTMLDYGFSMFGKTWKTAGTKRVFDRLVWLEPSTVDTQGWHITGDDDLEYVVRSFQAPDYKYEYGKKMPAGELVLYVWSLLGARFEGRPWTRAMYGPWYRKDLEQRLGLAWANHVGCPIPVGFYPKEYTPEQVTELTEVVKQLRGMEPELSYGVFPISSDGKEPTLKYIDAGGTEVDRMGSLINTENLEIAHAGGNKSQMLGETATGARSVGDVQQKREMLRLRSIAETVCELETSGVGNMPGLIEELVEMNFAGADPPRLVCEGIDPDEQQASLERLAMAKEKGLLPDHPAVYRRAAMLCDFSETDIPDDELVKKSEEAEENSGEPPAQNNSAEGQPAPLTGNPPEQGEGDEERPDSESLSLAASKWSAWLRPTAEGKPSSGGWRYPNRLELEVVQLAAVQGTFRTGQRDLSNAMWEIHGLAIDEIVKRVKLGDIDRRNLDGFWRSRFRDAGKAKALIIPVIDRVGREGATHAAQEVERLRGVKLEIGPIRVAGHKAATVALREFADESIVLVNMTVDTIWRNLLTEGIKEFNRLSRQGKAGADLMAELTAFLENLQSPWIEDEARKAASVAYNQGRAVSFATAKSAGAADIVVRSELLDNATCESCRVLDGTTYEIGSDDYYAFMPPAECDGGERCRGFYVALPEAVIPGEE